MDKPETAAERDEREAEIIAGEIPVELSDGRKVVVREIRWGESLRLGAQLRTIVLEVAKRETTGRLDPIAIFEIPEDHPEAFISVLALVTGLSTEELEGLPMVDGEKLQNAFWKQNTAFFARQVGRVLSVVRAVDKPEALATSTPLPPENSSQPSSDSGTASGS